jgi:hypothetical protein
VGRRDNVRSSVYGQTQTSLPKPASKSHVCIPTVTQGLYAKPVGGGRAGSPIGVT